MIQFFSTCILRNILSLGIWEYIENLRKIVIDLDSRVEKAQQNADQINKLMKKWDAKPLFTRYDDGRPDNLFNKTGKNCITVFPGIKGERK